MKTATKVQQFFHICKFFFTKVNFFFHIAGGEGGAAEPADGRRCQGGMVRGNTRGEKAQHSECTPAFEREARGLGAPLWGAMGGYTGWRLRGLGGVGVVMLGGVGAGIFYMYCEYLAWLLFILFCRSCVVPASFLCRSIFYLSTIYTQTTFNLRMIYVQFTHDLRSIYA